MRSILLLLAIPVGVATLVGVWIIAIHNELNRLHNQVKGGWAQIDVQLRRRYDLLSNLVDAIKGPVSQEKAALEAVLQARTQALRARGICEHARADQTVSQAMGRLMTVVEQYPDLKADQEFVRLQEELISTTQRMQAMSRQYNEKVKIYNTKLESLRASLVAGLFTFQEEALFEIAEPPLPATPAVRYAA